MGDAKEFPPSEVEAEEHIREIRKSKGLGDGPGEIGHNAADLVAALDILSADLYQTSTHFLLELIQNADDNQYETPVPTLRISYSPGRVRIDCNERGFSRRNVEAICRICQSTKSGRSKSTGFVGEKGIGFKSVFKVASTVQIASGHYQFKFERDSYLGMVAPIWSPFPEPLSPGWTSMLLKLDDSCDEAAIVDELRLYDGRILLFLRRLRRLEIEAQDAGSISSLLKNKLRKKRAISDAKFTNVLTRQEQQPASSSPADPASIVTVIENDAPKHYLVWRHMANKLPTEPRRPGISSSEVVLAFPLKSDCQTPSIAQQSVYAFLPIRDYGFNFLLQADFLLSTNREEIHGDSAWNRALADAASHAFVGAALYMSGLPEGNPLRYTWLLYFPLTAPSSDLMRRFWQSMVEKLRHSSVIYTREKGGKRKNPVRLRTVPNVFCDREGTPFTQTPKDAGKFVSREYDFLPADAKENPLRLLGAFPVSENQFMESLSEMLQPNPRAVLQHKSREWHVDLCRTLYSIVLSATIQEGQKSGQKSGRKSVQELPSTPVTKHLLELPIIPLRDGNWVRHGKGSESVYYAELGSGTGDIPEGINMRIVDVDAAADRDRRRLYDHLGVKTMADADVREAILRTHSSFTFRPDSLPLSVLISHAVFLFRSGWMRMTSNPCDLWFASENGPCRRSIIMYFPSDLPSAAYQVLPAADRGTPYGFLHRAYIEGAVESDRQDEWVEWLHNQADIPIYPRLCSLRPVNGSWMHPDFDQLRKDSPDVSSLRWLTILRDGWEYYDKYLRESGLVEELMDTVVPCRGSSWSAPLKWAYMPVKSLVGQAPGLVPYVQISDPDNPEWEPVMELLRVPSEPSMRFYADCLRGCHTNPKVSQDTIRTFLHNIQDEGANSRFELRKLFDEYDLICIPPKQEDGQRTWVKPTSCVWKGKAWMAKYHVLEKYYPELEVLFQAMLQIPNANVTHFVEEAIAVPSTTAATKSTRRIESILHALTSHVVANLNKSPDRADLGLESSYKTRLIEANMFPIVSGTRNQPYERLSSVADKDSWLIADRTIFRTQFANVLPVLALDAGVVLRIQPLLEALDLKDRFLSRAATNVTEAHGEVTPLEDLATQYRERSKFLFRLMPLGQPNQDQLRAKFRSVDVFSATTITQYWRAPLGLQQVQSAQTTGTAFLESDYFGDLRIYMPTGYETEPHPFELVEQLCEFFSISVQHRDLVLLALTAAEERVERVFASRGIGPLVDDGLLAGPLGLAVVYGHDESDTDSDGDAGYETAEEDEGGQDGETKKGASRFNRLLNRKRFHPSFFRQGNGSNESLPSYSAAVARTTHGGAMGGRLAPTRQLPGVFTLPSLKKTIREMEFHQKDGAVIAEPTRPPTLFDRIRGLAQRDVDIGEMIISDALAVILGPQYNPETIWTPRSRRRPNGSAFTFVDSQGRFSSFLMRLEGRTGKAQGYNKLMYHLDVKATERAQSSSFNLSQTELDRARQFSIHSEEALSDQEPNKHVSVLVHISDVRGQPKIVFLVDPWDLFKDGQLVLETTSTYKARLRLSPQGAGGSGSRARDAVEEGGFDTVQIRPRSSPQPAIPGEAPPEYVDVKGKGVEGRASSVGVTAGPSSEMVEVEKGGLE